MTGPSLRSALRKRLDAGEIAVVVAGHSMSSDTVDFLGPLGFDAVWLEGEHGPFTWDRLGDLSRSAELWGMAALLRVRTLDPTLIGRALSLGAHGIVIPQVSTAEQAAVAVAAARFAPEGSRGVSRGRRSYRAPGTDAADFFTTENDNTVVVVQLEDPTALANIDQIVAVEGLDVAFVAPNDLAQAMGLQGRTDHPEVVGAIDAAISRIAASGVAAGTLCRPDQVQRFVGLGARLLYVNSDEWLRSGAGAFAAAVRSATPPG